MTAILHLLASPRTDESCSRQFSTELVELLRQGDTATRVVTRDLAACPPPLVDEAFSAAVLGARAADHPAFAASETLITELEACEVLVIGTPMHNFGIPAVLKAWVDQVVRIHRSFGSTPAGKIGLLADRPVWLVVASGGWFTRPPPGVPGNGQPLQPDFLTPYLRTVLATIGLHDLRVITLEGIARGTEPRTHAFTAARATVERLLSNPGAPPPRR